MGLPLLLLLFLVAASCSGKSNLEGSSDNILALQWPKNICKVNDWTASGCEYSWWTIHGWWPPRCNNVNKDTYGYNKIKTLLKDLNKFWPDLSGRKTLWSHEWDAHGRAAAQKLTVHQYFDKALEYYSCVKSCAKHEPEKAKACFENLPSVKKCDLIRKLKDGKQIITEVRLHLN